MKEKVRCTLHGYGEDCARFRHWNWFMSDDHPCDGCRYRAGQRIGRNKDRDKAIPFPAV